jgi:hypothetical protein
VQIRFFDGTLRGLHVDATGISGFSNSSRGERRFRTRRINAVTAWRLLHSSVFRGQHPGVRLLSASEEGIDVAVEPHRTLEGVGARLEEVK